MWFRAGAVRPWERVKRSASIITQVCMLTVKKVFDGGFVWRGASFCPPDQEEGDEGESDSVEWSITKDVAGYGNKLKRILQVRLRRI